jgi:hypothetical protein
VELVMCACEFIMTHQALSKLQHYSVVVNLDMHCGPCLFPISSKHNRISLDGIFLE